MNLAETLDDVLRISSQAENEIMAWREFVGYLESSAGASFSNLKGFDIESDVNGIGNELRGLEMTEPYPKVINAIYFGIFDSINESGEEVTLFYVAGIRDFDPEDPDSLCDPFWWPEERYLSNRVLGKIKEEERIAHKSGDESLRGLLGYTGQIGAAVILATFGANALYPGLTLVVGFDEGDFLVVERHSH